MESLWGWALRCCLRASKRMGPVLLETAGAALLFTDNDDFTGQSREQEPTYNLQLHLVYPFRNKIWLALDATRYMGGQTTVGGMIRDENQKVGHLYLQSTTRIQTELFLAFHGFLHEYTNQYFLAKKGFMQERKAGLFSMFTPLMRSYVENN